MKTAIELAEDKPSSIDDDLYAWATEAAAMLLKQAEQIEALKADAERYRWYVVQLESGNLDKLEETFKGLERVEVVTKQLFDFAIDAMKGTT